MYFRRCLNALFAQRAALARNSLQQEILIKAQTYVFSSPDRHELQKLFKFICLGHREGIWRDGAAFFKGG